jgi:hypothetical protein
MGYHTVKPARGDKSATGKNKKINLQIVSPEFSFSDVIKNSGVQSKTNEYHIVNKVEIIFVYKHIFNLIDNVVFVVLALYSRTLLLVLFHISVG